ncbi:MAG: tetratricopeptide repeat protein [Limisphaerales bacterium]
MSLAVCLFLAAAVWVVFAQTLHYEFIDFDDGFYTYNNPTVAAGLNWQGVAWEFTHADCHIYHPLTMLSLMVDSQLHGHHAGGYHFTNVLLHTALTVLLFLLLRGMTGAPWRSAFVAAVFAIHPLRIESVAWVAERKDVLSGLFFMLTIGAYVHYVRRPRSFPRYGLVALLFGLGLMCKPTLVTLPVVLLLLDYWPLRRMEFQKFSRLVMEKLPLLALSAASCVSTLLAQNTAIQSAGSYSLPHRLSNVMVSCMVYLGQMVWPARLAVFYPYPHNGPPLWEWALAGILLAGFSVVALRRRDKPWLMVGWLWYLAMLLPVVGIVQVGTQAHADRYTYLPQIGLYLLVAWGAADLCGRWRWRRAILACAAFAIPACLLVEAYLQTGYWKNSLTLWTHALDCAAESAVAHHCLGLALGRQGNTVEAIEHYKRALELDPAFAEAHNNLGDELARQGNRAEATEQFRRALELKPDYANACNNLANELAAEGMQVEAVALYRRALALNPAYAEAWSNLGNAMRTQGNLADAVEDFKHALALKPDIVETRYNLGLALADQGRQAEAVQHFQKALNLAMAQHKTKVSEIIRNQLASCESTLPRP